jgi:uncharacterized protein YecT (DUF1311 family)
VVLATAITVLPSGLAHAAADRDWRQDGLAAAEAAIATCLETKRFGDGEQCVGRTYDLCEERHGDQQQTMNACSGFARQAWTARLRVQIRRVAATPMARKNMDFAATQRRWEQWEARDCEVQSALSVGGSMHDGLVNNCHLRHIGARAIELEALAEAWESR